MRHRASSCTTKARRASWTRAQSSPGRSLSVLPSHRTKRDSRESGPVPADHPEHSWPRGWGSWRRSARLRRASGRWSSAPGRASSPYCLFAHAADTSTRIETAPTVTAGRSAASLFHTHPGRGHDRRHGRSLHRAAARGQRRRSHDPRPGSGVSGSSLGLLRSTAMPARFWPISHPPGASKVKTPRRSL